LSFKGFGSFSPLSFRSYFSFFSLAISDANLGGLYGSLYKLSLSLQSFIVLSSDPESKNSPSFEKSMLLTAPQCPFIIEHLPDLIIFNNI
jgi:hypothetical protein